MQPSQEFVLSTGNRVTVDETGIRVSSQAGDQLASFDFSELRSASRSANGVTLVRSDGNAFEFTADASTADGLSAALSGGIQQEAPIKGMLGKMTRAIQGPPIEVQAQDAAAREAALEAEQQLQASAAGVDFDNTSQLRRIQGGLVPDETLLAVYDMKGGGTGFVGITDRRIITQDEGRWGKGRYLVSIPYGQIAMVASKDEGGMMRKTSELTIVTSNGQAFEFPFRTADKAERAYTFIIQHLR